MIKFLLVIFDYDGVLLDREINAYIADDQAYKVLG